MSSELLLGTLPGPRITSGTSRERRSVVVTRASRNESAPESAMAFSKRGRSSLV